MRATIIKSAAVLTLLFITIAVTQSMVWWLAVAVFATFIIALLIIVDGFFFVDNIYHSTDEPTAISGLMQGLPLLLIPFVQIDYTTYLPIFVAFTTGIVYAYAFNLYFKTLNDDPDAVVISIIWNLMFALVPVIAYFSVKEDLTSVQYIGIAMIVLGATIAAYRKIDRKKITILRMLIAVILLSAGEVALKWVFLELATTGSSSVFWTGSLVHSAGGLFVGLLFLAKISYTEEKRSKFIRLVTRFWWIFVIIEVLQVIADFLTNYSISMGHVSVVVSMGGLMGVFVMSIATFLVYISKGTWLQKTFITLQESQFEHFYFKLLGMSIITFGAYLMT